MRVVAGLAEFTVGIWGGGNATMQLVVAPLAAAVDADAFRALWALMGMLAPPSDVYTDPALIARVRAVLADGTPTPVPSPARADLERALSGH